MNGPGDFERELERELHRILDPIAAATIPLRRAPSSGGMMKRLLGGAGAALGVKLLTGLAVAASAAVLAGAATEVAVTGSLNPVTWGQNVTQTVQTCKDTLRASGVRGIGQCVSVVAKQRGEQVSDSNASKARDNGKAKSNGNGNGNDKGKGNDNGQDNGKGNGKGNGNGNGHKPGSSTNPGTDSRTSMLMVW